MARLWRHSGRRLAAGDQQGTVMLDEPFQRLPGQVQPVECGIAALELGHNAQALRVMVEAAKAMHRLVERLLAGMAERRVAEIVRQRDRLGEIFVEPQGACDLRAICATSRLWVRRVR